MTRLSSLLLFGSALFLAACEQSNEPIPEGNFLVVNGYHHDYGTQPGETLTKRTNDDGSTTFQWSADQSEFNNKRIWEVTLPEGTSLQQDQSFTLGPQAVPISESGVRLASVRVIDLNTPEACFEPASLNGELKLGYFERGDGSTIVLQFDDIQFIRVCDNEDQVWGNLSGQLVYTL